MASRDNSKEWFSNLFKCATISMNVSSKGPITISTTPAGIFKRDVLENLGVRAILSAGIGDQDYQDRLFSARITLPRIRENIHEALIFNFVVRENSKQITLKVNSKALTLLIFIYPRKFRKYVNRFEDELELILSQSEILPGTTSELLEEASLDLFIKTLRKTVITFENESLLNYDEFEMTDLYDEDKMPISTANFLDELM